MEVTIKRWKEMLKGIEESTKKGKEVRDKIEFDIAINEQIAILYKNHIEELENGTKL